MSRLASFALLFAVMSATAAEQPAKAQCRLCNAPTTERDGADGSGEVSLEVETGLDFDQLILFGNGEGTARLHPNGSRTTGGSIADMGPRAMAGTVIVHGEPGRAVRIDMPRRIILHSVGGGQVTFDDLVSDAPDLPRLDSTGRLMFRFGGKLTISGDAEGDFRGDLPITVEYQ